MSFLHITYKGREATIYWEDGKSDLLDRYVNYDTGAIYYTMGKQISGKPIDPEGKVGREILQITDYWVNNPETQWSTPIFSHNHKSGCFIASAAFGTSHRSEIVILSAIRDSILTQSALGMLFVRFYYFISPSIARFVSITPCSALFITSTISRLNQNLRKLLIRHCKKNYQTIHSTT